MRKIVASITLFFGASFALYAGGGEAESNEPGNIGIHGSKQVKVLNTTPYTVYVQVPSKVRFAGINQDYREEVWPVSPGAEKTISDGDRYKWFLYGHAEVRAGFSRGSIDSNDDSAFVIYMEVDEDNRRDINAQIKEKKRLVAPRGGSIPVELQVFPGFIYTDRDGKRQRGFVIILSED